MTTWTDTTKTGREARFDNLLINDTDTLLINTTDKLTLQDSTDSSITTTWATTSKT